MSAETRKTGITARQIAVTGVLSAAAFVLQLIEFPLPFLIPPFIKFDFSDLDYTLPDPAELETILREAGGWALRERLGVDRAGFYGAFAHAARVNTRYTILTFLLEKGCLDPMARAVTAQVYGD